MEAKAKVGPFSEIAGQKMHEAPKGGGLAMEGLTYVIDRYSNSPSQDAR